MIKKIVEYRERLETELFKHVIPFWQQYSVDWEHGGFYSCLDRDGKLYDTSKYIWLNARQVWMFSKLYRSAKADPIWLKMAKNGAQFLKKYAINKEGRVYFKLSKEGKPVTLQRKIFSECFYVMAMAEYARASGQMEYLKLAQDEFEKVWMFSRDPGLIGRAPLEGADRMQNLAVPMILLNLIEELTDGSGEGYQSQVDQCIEQMLMHVDSQKKMVFENVGLQGQKINSPEGRHLNPGHAIEAGWFLQNWAQKRGDSQLVETAINMVRWSHQLGWDNQYGGYFYFLDSEGYSPVQLEWDMKLWWPHNEAMVAHLKNYQITGQKEDFINFCMVTDYALQHFSDPKYGEWYGYLNRRGEVTHRFKGGPYKCCFHVPRSLLYSIEILKKLEGKLST